MSVETETVETEDQVVEETGQDEEQDAPQEEPTPDPAEGALKALRAERQARRAAEKRARELEQAAEAANLEPDEQRLEEARREARQEVATAYHKRLLKSAVQTAAKGRLSDPADAFRFLDLDKFEVSDDDEIDTGEIEQAIDELLSSKPYLAAGEPKRFQGGADQGAKGNKSPAQVTRDQLSNMTPEQITKAQKDGRLNDLLGVKN